jgi:hypothetical protein
MAPASGRNMEYRGHEDAADDLFASRLHLRAFTLPDMALVDTRDVTPIYSEVTGHDEGITLHP